MLSTPSLLQAGLWLKIALALRLQGRMPAPGSTQITLIPLAHTQAIPEMPRCDAPYYGKDPPPPLSVQNDNYVFGSERGGQRSELLVT